MKRLSLFVAIGLLAAGLTLQAAQGKAGRGRRMDVDQRLTQMQKQLNLTSDQVNRIRPILQEENQKMENLRTKNQNNGSRDRTAVRKEMQQIRQDSMKQIDSVLTPDQVTKLHQKRGNSEGRRRNNRNG
jgi:Spy/CpxP family protein refolding chaperone